MEPFISIIIPVRPEENTSLVLESIKKSDYPKNKIEVFIIKGRNPSKQRNEAIKVSKGEILFFFDNDVIFDESHIKKVLKHFSSEEVMGVGGSVETAGRDTFLQKCFGYVLSSYFATQRMRYKFKSVGKKVIKATEKELILCNLSMRKKAFENDLFNENIYPNEENELLNRLTSKNYKILYDPEAVIYRSHRETLFRFAKQLFNYGRGRMEHFLLQPKFFSPLFILPTLFLFYLISLLFFQNIFYLIPFFVYISLNLIFSFQIVFKTKCLSPILIVPLLFFMVHLMYGLGFLYGPINLFKKYHKKESEILINRLEL